MTCDPRVPPAHWSVSNLVVNRPKNDVPFGDAMRAPSELVGEVEGCTIQHRLVANVGRLRTKGQARTSSQWRLNRSLDSMPFSRCKPKADLAYETVATEPGTLHHTSLVGISVDESGERLIFGSSGCPVKQPFSTGAGNRCSIGTVVSSDKVGETA